MFKTPKKLIIVSDGVTHTLNPGDKFCLNVDIDFNKNSTSISVKAPITFAWDGYKFTKIDGP